MATILSRPQCVKQEAQQHDFPRPVQNGSLIDHNTCLQNHWVTFTNTAVPPHPQGSKQITSRGGGILTCMAVKQRSIIAMFGPTD